MIRMAWIAALALSLGCAASTVRAQADPDVRGNGDPEYLRELQARAREQNLAVEPGWQRLVHYVPDRIGRGVHSVIDDPIFFVAADGARNPATELAATLAVFFSDVPRVEEPQQCRYRARYLWLRQRLTFDPQRMPEHDCSRYQTWAAGLAASTLAMVFASNDLNSPSSMFGHTLLRVDARSRNQSEQLLSYAINYAAYTGPDAGALYALRGLVGGYKGYFALFPYYEKVKEYARIEHRDLWEYPLRLDADQVQGLLAHLWELRGVGSDYYFLSENCSYQLLLALETVRPELALSARFREGFPYAIPIDTVRVLRDAGLLDLPSFRPSQARQIRHRFGELTPSQQTWVRRYAAGDAALDASALAAEPVQAQARMLELAHDFLYLAFQDEDLNREQALPRARAALVERARLGIADAGFSAVPQPASSPDQGHGSGRVSGGIRFDDERSASLFRIRPAYHDRLDPPAGYLAGGEIEFLDLEFLADSDGLDLDAARLLSIQALAPRDEAFKSWSWQFSTGVRRYAQTPIRSGGSLGGYVDGGGGLAWALGGRSQTYLFAFSEADANRGIEKGFAVSAGARFGTAVQWSDRFTQQLEADVLGPVAGAASGTQRLRWGSQWQFLKDCGLRLGLAYQRIGDEESTTVDLLVSRYF